MIDILINALGITRRILMLQKVSHDLVLPVLASYLQRIVAILIFGILHKELLVSDEHVQDLQAVIPRRKVQDVPFI